MHSPFRLLLSSAALMALCACATASPSLHASAPPVAPANDHASVYGLYLAGEAALASGDSQSAAALFGRAQSANPDAPFLRDRLFIAALMAGDVPKAAMLASAPTAPDDGGLGALVQAVEALSAGKGAETAIIRGRRRRGEHRSLRHVAGHQRGDEQAVPEERRVRVG